MAADAFETKQRVKEAVDIVDLVGSYLQLRHEGRGYKALCPWHDDSRPSLSVNPERQSFRCWVCDLGGDVFSFVMRMEGVTFPEALALLAERAGIPLAARGRSEGPPPGSADDKQTLYGAMSWAVGRLHECLLRDPRAEPARSYLAARGLTAESIAAFRLGYAPDEWTWLVDTARGTPYSPAILERVGLIGRRRNGPGHYDRFKGRVIFPICDAQGRAIALGGRVLPALAPQDAAKYVNSPETPLFAKSQQLYGLERAREAVRRGAPVLVMEGYTDCIMAHQFGHTSAVAVLGTALGSAHVRLLRRMAERPRVVLVLDGDEAGRRRANEILETFVAENVDLRVLTLPDEQDPCEFLLARGGEAFAGQVAGAIDALAHARQVATAGLDLRRDLQAAAEALERLLATIAKAPRLRSDTTGEDRLRVELFLRRLASDFAVPEEQLRRRVAELRRASAPRSVAPAAPPPALHEADPCEVALLELLVQAPELLSSAPAESWARLRFGPGRRIVGRVRDLLDAGATVDFSRLLLEFDDPAIKNLLVELDERWRSKRHADPTATWREVLAAWERRGQEEQMRASTAALRAQRLDQEEELRRLSEVIAQQRARQGISALTDEPDAPAG